MLRRLVETTEPVLVQDTTFSHDVLGRYVCNTWDEAVGNGGAPFDVVVLGAGMYGAYCAEKIYRADARGALRILVLDAGSFLVSTHVQNLPRMGLNAAPAVSADPGVPRAEVWGLRWRGPAATLFPGLAYCVGGRSLYWGGWSPRLTGADLAQWPADLATYLRGVYADVEAETGVSPTTDYISGPLYDALRDAFQAAAPGVPTVDGIEEAPLAVQGQAPASGLFPFDKYSSAPILVQAIREASGAPDASRRLFLVPRAHVVRLHAANGAVDQVEVDVGGQRRFLPVGRDTAVVVALGTIESTRLALASFPTDLIGRNLMAHLRSNTTVRIKRSVLSNLPSQLEAAALLVRGSTPRGRYHLQVTAAAVMGTNPEDVMWAMVPDIDLLHRMLAASQQPEWITITLRGIGEMAPDTATPVATQPAKRWINLSPYEFDEFGVARAWVNLLGDTADPLWQAMDDAAIAIAQKIAGDPANIQYLHSGGWQTTPPPPGALHDNVGTTHHEAGTLWMGADPGSSVTDLNGRFHHVANAYAVGPAVFPQMGSANPSLTAWSLARRTAAAVVASVLPSFEPDFTPLFDGTSMNGWQMAGSGRFNLVGHALESEGGIGLLWYTPATFGDFVLRCEWRATNPDDNSGVFIRFPALGSSDPANDWRLAVDQGYEIQIDDRGYNPDTNTTGDALHQTGAVYRLAASSRVTSRPLGQWNSYEITARAATMTVVLNGETVTTYTGDGSRPATGHVGIQNHHQGSRVAFRNIRIKPL